MIKEKSDKKFFLSNETGFTLVELLVSISIISLLSAAFVVNYHRSNKENELKLAAYKLASDIRLTQNKTLGSETAVKNGTTYIPPWGINLTASTSNYKLFGDIVEDKSYVANDDYLLRQVNLPNKVIIKSLKVGDPLAGVTSANIIFYPPNPTTYIKGDSQIASHTSALITLQDENNATYNVSVNFVGLIDVSQ